MSGLPPKYDQLVSAYRLILNESYVSVATCALVVYEIIISIDKEIAHIWTRKLTSMTFLFALNRLAVLFLVLTQMLTFTVDPQSVRVHWHAISTTPFYLRN